MVSAGTDLQFTIRRADAIDIRQRNFRCGNLRLETLLPANWIRTNQRMLSPI